MKVSVTIKGVTPGLLMHSGAGALDMSSPINKEKRLISAKRKKTEDDERRLLEIEARQSIWVSQGKPTVPPHVFRSAIWQAAKLERRGMDVNRTLRMDPDVTFTYAPELTGLPFDEMAKRVTFLSNVRVQSSRVVRARGLFMPWAASFGVWIAADTITESDLRRWVELCGERIGIGDWRPDKGGVHGMFTLASFEVTE